MYVQCKMYVQLCSRWKAYNRTVFVQNCPDLKPRVPSAGKSKTLKADNKKGRLESAKSGNRARIADVS
jgi:hypothetical protein